NRPDRDAEATKKKAEEILANIKGGASFAEMASLHSDDSQRSEGGLWPPVYRDTLREDLGKVAFQLKPGETSDIVEREDGCYLLIGDDGHARRCNEEPGLRLPLEPFRGYNAPGRIFVHRPSPEPLPEILTPGSAVAARAAVEWLTEGGQRCLLGDLDALVTAP